MPRNFKIMTKDKAISLLKNGSIVQNKDACYVSATQIYNAFGLVTEKEQTIFNDDPQSFGVVKTQPTERGALYEFSLEALRIAAGQIKPGGQAAAKIARGSLEFKDGIWNQIRAAETMKSKPATKGSTIQSVENEGKITDRDIGQSL